MQRIWTPSLWSGPSPHARAYQRRTRGGSALLTNLVSYWKLDEASGTRNDAHGSNHLTDNNTVGSTTGVLNNAALFVRANAEYLSRASNSDLQTGNIDFTLTAWFYLNSTGVVQSLIQKAINAPVNYEYLLEVRGDDKLRWQLLNGSGGSSVALVDHTLVLSASTWYFAVAWFDAAAGIAYLKINDGAAQSAAKTANPGVGVGEFRIGSRQDGSGDLDGRADEVGLWKRVLTSTEHTTLYGGGTPPPYPF